jgi:DNA-binding MurR/RpiR family transcriptional regulator
MQRVFRLRLTDAMPDYKERLRSLHTDATTEPAKDGASLLDQFVQADIVGLQRLSQQRRTGELLEQAIKLIADCDTVYLVAHRRSFPVAATSPMR